MTTFNWCCQMVKFNLPSFGRVWNGAGIVWRQDERDQEHQVFLVKWIIPKSLILMKCICPKSLILMKCVIPKSPILMKRVIPKSLILVKCVIPKSLINAGTIVPGQDPVPAPLFCVLHHQLCWACVNSAENSLKPLHIHPAQLGLFSNLQTPKFWVNP